MKKLISFIVIVSLFFLASSCATLFKGTSEEVNFNSNPVGVEIWIDGIMMGKTPIKFKLITKKTYVIEFKLKGHESKVVNLTNHVGASWIVLDILGGLLPAIIDLTTGAWYSFDENHINVTLQEIRRKALNQPLLLYPKI